MITEEINPASVDIDTRSTEEILEIINREDQKVAEAVGREIPNIARAIEIIVDALARGRRLFYVGAGTSGRIGVLDAVECPPTFGISPETIQGVIAGGYEACYRSVEVAEDDAVQGADDLWARGVMEGDVVLGIAASGRTPYTRGALELANRIKARTIALTCDPNSEIARMAEVAISPVVGPEVLAGSTRLKAGTAQKMVLNMLSTAAMIRLGRVYSNLMVNVQMHNQKLIERGKRILMIALDVDYREAERRLREAGYDLRLAIIMGKRGATREEALRLFIESNQHVRRAINEGARS